MGLTRGKSGQYANGETARALAGYSPALPASRSLLDASMENPHLPSAGSKDITQLWKCSSVRGANLYTNIATNFSTSNKPSLASGGILADDMGLGKTLQVISLILQGGSGTTLIIAPVSVMSNWSQQMARHIKTAHALRVLAYHGHNRNILMGPNDFEKYDVVITSYGTIASEFVSAEYIDKTGLFSMDWRRVVLDEGHIIRNPSTRAAVATSSLQAQSRWVLSGTPIINTIKDLYSMLKFLRITGGLEKMELFNAILARPLAAGDPQADILLQSIMRTMRLRRKKDMKFVDLKLPELSEFVHKIQFRKDELHKYNALQAEAKGMLHEYNTQAPGSKPINTYRHLLEVLLRLRQVCCHWKLCEERITALLSLIESTDVVDLTPENKFALQVVLQLSIDSQDECSVCLETLHNPVITACKHAFDLDCITRVIETQQKCPLCRAALDSVDTLVHPAPTVDPNAEEESDIDVETQSSKTEALMQILTATLKHCGSKVVIFSQWTSLLSIIGAQLSLAGPTFNFTRLDGSMSAPARDRALSTFDSSPSCRILLASLQVCSVGLNLVAADTVILMDSWWAPAIEDQAVDRVHRLGQTRPTRVWRLIMEDSVEERVLEVQKEKRILVGKAFREKGERGSGRGEKRTTARLGDIQRLLG